MTIPFPWLHNVLWYLWTASVSQAVPVAEPEWSAAHKGLCLYISRVLQPIWERSIATTSVSSSKTYIGALSNDTLEVPHCHSHLMRGIPNKRDFSIVGDTIPWNKHIWHWKLLSIRETQLFKGPFGGKMRDSGLVRSYCTWHGSLWDPACKILEELQSGASAKRCAYAYSLDEFWILKQISSRKYYSQYTGTCIS